jgi:dipeptidyl aminopeptidase/acylaminoacyl peptidase
MPNIRGSSGYGKEFEKANNRCWGECDMEDVLAGVDYLKSLSYVDDEKMAITGRSYGGMLTMAAATNVHGVFQAMLAETGHEDWTKGGKVYDYELGSLPENYDLRWKLSPLSHVEDVSTPIFVILGEGPSPKASPFVEKLKEYNKEHIAKTYLGEGSSVHSFDARLQSLRDKLAFYDKYLKNKGEGVPK